MILAAVGGGIVVVILIIIIIVILSKKKGKQQNLKQKPKGEKFASELNDNEQQRDEETPTPQNVSNNESKDLRAFDSNATAQGLKVGESHNERATHAPQVEAPAELNSFRQSE